MNTIKEINAACAETITAMIEKGFVRPECTATIGDAKLRVTLNVARWEGPKLNPQDSTLPCYSTFFGDTLEEAFAAARARVAAQPDPETAALHRYMDKLGKVVDEGRADGIPDEYTQPVSLTIKAMSDNLLSAPEASS